MEHLKQEAAEVLRETNEFHMPPTDIVAEFSPSQLLPNDNVIMREASKGLEESKQAEVENKKADDKKFDKLTIDETQETLTNWKRTIKFLLPKKKKKKPKDKDVSIFDMLRYSDIYDKLLLTLGTLAAIASGCIYSVMFLMFGQVAGTLVNFTKKEEASSVTPNEYIRKCFTKATETSSVHFDEKMHSVIQAYIIFGVASLVANYLSYICYQISSERQLRRIRNKLFKSIIRQDIGYFDNTKPGELNSIITSNINTLQNALGFKFSDAITNIVRGLSCVVLALVSAWKFSIVFLAIAPIISIAMAFLVIKVKKYSIKAYKAYESAGVVAQETLSSLRTVFSLGLQSKFISKYTDNLSDAERVTIKKGLIIGSLSGVANLLYNGMFGIGVFYATYLIRTDCISYSPNYVMRSFFAIVTAVFAFAQSLPFFTDLTDARGAATRIFAIISRKSEIDVYEETGKKLSSLSGNIEFDNVHFSYPQRRDAKILCGLSLRVDAGKTIALCGASGGGKSTVIQLLQRFYKPGSGSIRLDGHNIEDLNLNWLRSQMSLVSQEPVLFATSIRENIRLGRLNATDAEIEEAAKLANAHSFITGLQDGYDTLVGERGGQLSGGQKQRISIARSLIRNPKILLLDEATSALDMESEKIVQDALDKAKVGRTTIIIAHRLSTIRNADLIICMSNGKVEETGTHSELMKQEGLYYKLVTTQKKEPMKVLTQRSIQSTISSSKSDGEEEGVDNDNGDDDDDGIDIPVNNQQATKLVHPKLLVNTPSTFDSPNLQKRRRVLKFERLLLANQKAEIPFIIMGTIAQMVCGLSLPAISLIFNEIYSIFTIPDPREQRDKSLRNMYWIIAIGVFNLIATFTSNVCFSLSEARLTKRLRAKMFTSMLRQEIGWHDLDENRSSLLTSRLASSVPLCKGLTIDPFNLLSQGISGVGVAIIVGFILNWRIALVMLPFVPVTFISGLLSARSSLNTNLKGKTTSEEGGNIATECVENIRTIVSLGREEYFYEKFKNVFKRKFRRSLAMLNIQGFMYSVTNSLLFFIQATAFGYGFQLIKRGQLEIKDLYRIYAIITFSSMVLGRVFSQMPDKKKARFAAKTAFKIILHVPKIDSMSEEGVRPAQTKGEINFEDVFFRYPTRDNRILNGLNLNIAAGEKCALVGQSGCGKSTTVQLFLRFYDVDSGRITLDGVDIRDLNINWLRKQIGFVSQEPVLFNTTIFENIAYGAVDQNVNMDEIVGAAKQANIHDRIEKLPDKYNTVVGMKGSQLSGGEKQRVAIARALLRKPKILLLDEATSALDTHSESIVQDALDKAQKGRTCITIAHRLSTIQNYGKISVFKEGKIFEEGSHADLMENKRLYYRLQTQNINEQN